MPMMTLRERLISAYMSSLCRFLCDVQSFFSFPLSSYPVVIDICVSYIKFSPDLRLLIVFRWLCSLSCLFGSFRLRASFLWSMSHITFVELLVKKRVLYSCPFKVFSIRLYLTHFPSWRSQSLPCCS